MVTLNKQNKIRSKKSLISRMDNQKRIGIVWFKRDLRLADHAPLKAAIDSGLPILLMYCYEPEIEQSPDFDYRHWSFIRESIEDINEQLPKNVNLHSFYGNAVDVFDYLSSKFKIANVWSHMETGTDITFIRDIVLKKEFKVRGIEWTEFQTNGVRRCFKNRDGWTKEWFKHQTKPVIEVDLERLNSVKTPDSVSKFNLPDSLIKKTTFEGRFQKGGETEAQKTLNSFISERYVNYNNHISKPRQSRTSCSRLSPYLAWGNLSIRQVFQKAKAAKANASNKRALNSFMSRLQWHCHFIQKFEDETEIEFRNGNRGFNDIRNEPDHAKIEAWKTGTTGIPLVDACMRCVIETGYLNFRMRAMLASFLTHHLWQPWRPGAIHLARQFLDFEPGIHYSQFQMQAGTLGVNTIRIYNPVKQSLDHDPEGVFIKRWLLELKNVPARLIHEPWRMSALEQSMYECVIGDDYPKPIIEDLKASYKEASSVLWSKKGDKKVKLENQRISKRHVRRGRG